MKINEKQLRQIIKESVTKILNENTIPLVDADGDDVDTRSIEYRLAKEFADWIDVNDSPREIDSVRASMKSELYDEGIYNRELQDEIIDYAIELIIRSKKNPLNEISYKVAKDAFKNGWKKYGLKGYYNNPSQKRKLELFHDYANNKRMENIDPDKKVIIVGGKYQGEYTMQEVIDNLPVNMNDTVELSPNSIYADSKLTGYPKLKGYFGPMADGDRIRYESPEAYDFFSK